jgi:hypothetical protein
MTTTDRIAAGWRATTFGPGAPGYAHADAWVIPADDPATLRTDDNGYRRDVARVRETAHGFALVWREHFRTLSGRKGDTRSVLVHSERRAELHAEKYAESRARAYQRAARRRRECLYATIAGILADPAAMRPGATRPQCYLRVLHSPGRPHKRPRVIVARRKRDVRVILSDLNRDYIVAENDARFGKAAAERHARAVRNLFSPVARAAERERSRIRRATETTEQREARLTKQREYQRARRARMKAQAAQ